MLFDVDQKVIQHDIIHSFIFNILPNWDPLILKDIDGFYVEQIQQLMYQYLKRKLDGVVNHDLTLASLQREVTLHDVSDRYKIYKAGFSMYNLNIMCKNSETSRCIAENFNKIKSVVTDNELQKLFLKSINEDPSGLTNKAVLIQIHEHLVNMEDLRQNYPLVYRFLQCVCIKSDTLQISESLYEYLRNTIQNVFFKKFHHLVKNELLIELVKTLSTNLANSIAYNRYLDPVDMRMVIINMPLIKQLGKFLEHILISDSKTSSSSNGERQ